MCTTFTVTFMPFSLGLGISAAPVAFPPCILEMSGEKAGCELWDRSSKYKLSYQSRLELSSEC